MPVLKFEMNVEDRFTIDGVTAIPLFSVGFLFRRLADVSARLFCSDPFCCRQPIAGFSSILLVAVLWVLSLTGVRAQSDISNIKLVLGEIPSQTYTQGDWLGFNTLTSLQDGTELSRYVAEVSSSADNVATNSQDDSLTIRFTFVPRFNCTPLISIIKMIPERLAAEELTTIEKEFGELEVFVDGTRIAYPALVEKESGYLKSFYNTNLQRRANFRILLEVGTSLFVKLGEQEPVKFSLSGSKRAINTAIQRCKTHS